MQENDDDTWTELQCQKERLEARYTELEQQLLAQKMENMVWTYRDKIIDALRDLRKALLSAFGQDLNSSEDVLRERWKLQEACSTRQSLGYTFWVHREFMEHVEKSILCGQVPERQVMCTKTDNSGFDPIQGEVTDVVYKLSMPMIIKLEVPDEEDVFIVGETTAERPRMDVVTVKQEKGTSVGNIENTQNENQQHVVMQETPGGETQEAQNDEAEESEKLTGVDIDRQSDKLDETEPIDVETVTGEGEEEEQGGRCQFNWQPIGREEKEADSSMSTPKTYLELLRFSENTTATVLSFL